MAENNKTVKVGGKEYPVVPTPYEDIFTDIKDIGKGAVNIGIQTLNLPSELTNIPIDAVELFTGKKAKYKAPTIPPLELSTSDRQNVATLAGITTDLVLFPKAIISLATKSPKLYSYLSQAFPTTVGATGRALLDPKLSEKGKLQKLAEIFTDKKGLKQTSRNLAILAGGTAVTAEDQKAAPELDALDVDYDVVQKKALGGDISKPGQFTGSINTAAEENVDIKDIQNQPGYMSLEELESLFEDAKLKPKTQEQPTVQTASLLGKVPIWAVANVDKAKTLVQQFSRGEIELMESIKNKLGLGKTKPKAEPTREGEVDIFEPQVKATISDSPEAGEAVFYSALEARLMSPNTPETFASKQAAIDFFNKNGIGKSEIEDTLVQRYLDASEKNNLPIVKSQMLEVVRQAPLRKMETVIYGPTRYGGTKRALYENQSRLRGERVGEVPDSYREHVLYLPGANIPMDPIQKPTTGTAHSFDELYVQGWTRLVDFDLPLPKNLQTKGEGLEGINVNVLKRNQKKLQNQLKGLEASAYEKLRREIYPNLTPSDEMNPRYISETIDSRIEALQEIDEPLANQIRQFKSKIQDDANKINEFEGSNKVRVTIADEIQSDILQNAKKQEKQLKEGLGELLQKSPSEIRSAIQAANRSYRDETSGLRNLDPDVAEFYAANRTVFRPMFSTAQELQQFVLEFANINQVMKDYAAEGLRPSKGMLAKVKQAEAKQTQMLQDLQTMLSSDTLIKLQPNVPLKKREDWASALMKNDLAMLAQDKFVKKNPNASSWYLVNSSKEIIPRWSQSGDLTLPPNQRSSSTKGVGTDEFYGGPDATDYKGKHYTSIIEKELKRLAKDNNSRIEIFVVDTPNGGKQKLFGIEITPEMLLPHKTHRSSGGMVYNTFDPHMVDIFEVA